MFVTLMSCEPSAYGTLPCAPNVAEVEHISEILKNSQMTTKGLLDGSHRVLYCHRGWEMYLDNGAILHRTHPTTSGGNGYISSPQEPEKCKISYEGKWYDAVADFNEFLVIV